MNSSCDFYSQEQPQCSTEMESGRHYIRVTSHIDSCHHPARLISEVDVSDHQRTRVYLHCAAAHTETMTMKPTLCQYLTFGD